MAALPEHLSKKPVGTVRISREALEGHQRDKVVAAAVRVFAERGYQRTTVDHIVAAAKVGVGSFYNLFGGKEDCFLRGYDQIIDETRTAVSAAIGTETEWPMQARAGLVTVLEQIEAEPAKARLALAESQSAGPSALDRYRATIDSLIPLLARGRDVSPWADELPDQLEPALSGGLAWFLQVKVVEGAFKSAEAHLPEVLEIVVEPYIGSRAVAKL